jgi:hypothetical protein
MKNKIEDLRNHLFLSLEKLSEATPEELQTELERSKAIAEVAKVIVDSAKVEVDYVKATHGEVTTTSFMVDPSKQLKSA